MLFSVQGREIWLDEWGLNPECFIGRRFLRLGVGVILAEELHILGRGRGREVRTVPRVNALTFALQQSKMTENVGESSCEMLGTNSSCCRLDRLFIAVLDWTAYFQSLSPEASGPSSRPLVSAQSEKLPNKGFPLSANFETKPPVVPRYDRHRKEKESKGSLPCLEESEVGPCAKLYEYIPHPCTLLVNTHLIIFLSSLA